MIINNFEMLSEIDIFLLVTLDILIFYHLFWPTEPSKEEDSQKQTIKRPKKKDLFFFKTFLLFLTFGARYKKDLINNQPKTVWLYKNKKQSSVIWSSTRKSKLKKSKLKKSKLKKK
jgi:hypothetical protein